MVEPWYLREGGPGKPILKDVISWCTKKFKPDLCHTIVLFSQNVNHGMSNLELVLSGRLVGMEHALPDFFNGIPTYVVQPLFKMLENLVNTIDGTKLLLQWSRREDVEKFKVIWNNQWVHCALHNNGTSWQMYQRTVIYFLDGSVNETNKIAKTVETAFQISKC